MALSVLGVGHTLCGFNNGADNIFRSVVVTDSPVERIAEIAGEDPLGCLGLCLEGITHGVSSPTMEAAVFTAASHDASEDGGPMRLSPAAIRAWMAARRARVCSFNRQILL
jgi:hypothetical protein